MTASTHTELQAGIILDIARAAGIKVRDDREKFPVRCPFHEDKTASAFINGKKNVFFCSCCTASGGWTAKKFAEALGVPWVGRGGALREHDLGARPVEWAPKASPATESVRCTVGDVRELWSAAHGRAHDDAKVDADAKVYAFLRERRLTEAWTEGGLGLLGPGMKIPTVFEWWISSGYRLVVPAYDSTGNPQNVQARRVWSANDDRPKTMNPPDRPMGGLVFADPRGVEVLRGCWTGPRRLLWLEGLTDTLGASFTSPIPVVSSPGANKPEASVGPWVAGFHVFVALDVDKAGSMAATRLGHALRDHGALPRRLLWPKGDKDLCDALVRLGTAGLRRFFAEHITEARS